MTQPFCLCVYCGSRGGDDPAFAASAREVGRQIGERGWRLIYGGGGSGMMGEVANAALHAGAHVTGVIPQRLVERESARDDLSELKVVQTMHQRKHLMAEHADAFLALPGGLGTFEEVFEIWTWRQLGYHGKPVGLLNVSGYFDALVALVDHAVARGFTTAAHRDLLRVGQDVGTLLDDLAR